MALTWGRFFRDKTCEPRLPVLVFSTFYFITTFVGGIALGLYRADLFELTDSVNIPTTTTTLNNPIYWTMLFAPLIVPIGVLSFLKKQVDGEPAHAKKQEGPDRLHSQISKTAWCASFFAASLYCFLSLIQHDYLLNAFYGNEISRNFSTAIRLRTEMFNNLGGIFYGLIYQTLPFISHVAFFQALRTRRIFWRIAFASSFLTICFLDLSTIQKAPVLIYVTSLAIGAIALRVAKLKTVLGTALIIVGSITAMQRLLLGDWDWLQSIYLVFFRMASSLPFYFEVYPDRIDFTGIDFGQDIFGFGPGPRDNIDVFDHMYTGGFEVQGNVSAAAHIRAYTQGGVPYAMVTLVIIGWAIKKLGDLSKYIQQPLAYGLYASGMVFLYHLTQTSLREALISSYGIIWALAGYFILKSTNILTSAKNTGGEILRPCSENKHQADQGRLDGGPTVG